MIFECDIVHVCRRSRLGAWIEIMINIHLGGLYMPSLPFGSVD